MQPTLLPHSAHLAYSAFSWASDITSDMGDPFILSLAHNKKQALEEGKYLLQTDNNKALLSQEQRQTLSFSLPHYLQTTKTPGTSFHSSNSSTFHNNTSKLSIPVSPSFAEEDAENGHQCERQDGPAASKDMGRAEEESKLENFIALRELEDTLNLYKSKRPKITELPSPSSLVPSKMQSPKAQSRGKEKFGDKITALQQLVSPFGKTDTASVLLEAIGYIKFLHCDAPPSNQLPMTMRTQMDCSNSSPPFFCLRFCFLKNSGQPYMRTAPYLSDKTSSCSYLLTLLKIYDACRFFRLANL